MPSFNGQDLGDCTIVFTEPNEIEMQVNAYPGVNGLEVLTGGSRGGKSLATGIWYGADENALAAIQSAWIGLQVNAVVGTLIDSKGATWTNVMVTGVHVVGEIEELNDIQGLAQPFRIEFLHTS